ncbi:MAG: glycoside hydrolase family 17 protein [Ktedonobacteraceae bacterium]
MLRSTHKSLPLVNVATLAFVLGILLVGCSAGASQTPPNPSATFASDAACMKPEPAPGKISLACLAYGPAHTGQDPTRGIFPSSEQIQADMPTLASLTHYTRTYGSTGPAKAIIQAAEAAHICVASGIWLGSDLAANTMEMMAGEQLASYGAVHAIIVGNEVLLRGDLSEGQLRSNIEQVRAKLGRAVPITTADTYNEWLAHPALAQAVDFITVNIYPFWQGISVDSTVQSLDQAYTQVEKAFPHKQIVIGETGWPSAGPPHGAAVPSAENQARYLRAFISWAQSHQVQYFYFEAFDEDWKTNEAGVGTHWGLYQQDGQVKPALSDMLPIAASDTLLERSYRDVYVGGLEAGFGLGVDTSGQQRHWLTEKDGVLTLAYPAHQQWGTMLITAGQPALPGQRQSMDLSTYQALEVDMRAETDGHCVRIGIKDNTQPDNGSETTVPQCLSTNWATFKLPLKAFVGANLTRLYIVFEIFFQGSSTVTVQVRNIRYSPI